MLGMQIRAGTDPTGVEWLGAVRGAGQVRLATAALPLGTGAAAPKLRCSGGADAANWVGLGGVGGRRELLLERAASTTPPMSKSTPAPARPARVWAGRPASRRLTDPRPIAGFGGAGRVGGSGARA
jgi:hypothetical protein